MFIPRSFASWFCTMLVVAVLAYNVATFVGHYLEIQVHSLAGAVGQ